MAKDRIYASLQYRDLAKALQEKKILGLDTASNLSFFLFTMALGINTPVELQSRDGFIRYEYCKTKDKALLSCALLGNAKSDDEVERYIEFDTCTDYCEQCAESGIAKLQKMYNDAECDEELLERRMLTELDKMYSALVESDIDDI